MMSSRSQNQQGPRNQGKSYVYYPDGTTREFDVIWRAEKEKYDSDPVDLPESLKPKSDE